jgi:hypothetical protein
MTEQSVVAAPNEPPVGAPAPNPPERDRVSWFYGLGFLILAAAIFYVWQNPRTLVETQRNAAATQALQQSLAAVDGRLSKLEQRPAPDIGKLAARVDVLEGRVSDQTQLASRMDTLSGRIESMAGRDQTSFDALKQQLDALTSRVAALEANSGGLDAASKRINRIAKLQEASLDLAAGRPVGDLPNAPEAIARYAHTAPPTEAKLRLEFHSAKQAALAAKQPEDSSQPFVGRVWEKAQGMLTIRQGDHLMVGNTSADLLNQATAALDAGDLPAAVKAVEALKGAPKQAMAEWLGKAEALLSARAALANMTDQA